MAKKTGNSTYLKEYNRCMLMALVRENGSISYTDLSRLSGLAPKSVYEIVNGLIEDCYITEAFIGESSGGRRPAMLSLRIDSYYSIGFDIDVGRIKEVLMDFTGKVIYEKETITDNSDYEFHVNSIVDSTRRIIKDFSLCKDNLLGVGISVPGFINSKTKVIIMAPNLGWENKDLRNDLQSELDFNVYIENDAMASAVCEKWIGDCKYDKDFICISIMSGIGAGIYTSDKPYRGVSGSAGEIGHITVEKNGPLCGCKNKGCLETFASTKAILKKAREVINENLTLEELIVLGKSGDQRALEVFNTAADYLGLAICFLVNTFNPSKIVLTKDFTKYSSLMIDSIIERVRTTTIWNNYNSVVITTSSFGERASVLGAAILPVRKIFNI